MVLGFFLSWTFLCLVGTFVGSKQQTDLASRLWDSTYFIYSFGPLTDQFLLPMIKHLLPESTDCVKNSYISKKSLSDKDVVWIFEDSNTICSFHIHRFVKRLALQGLGIRNKNRSPRRWRTSLLDQWSMWYKHCPYRSNYARNDNTNRLVTAHRARSCTFYEILYVKMLQRQLYSMTNARRSAIQQGTPSCLASSSRLKCQKTRSRNDHDDHFSLPGHW